MEARLVGVFVQDFVLDSKAEAFVDCVTHDLNQREEGIYCALCVFCVLFCDDARMAMPRRAD